MQRERAHRRVDLYSGTERQSLQRTLERRVTHASNERQLVFVASQGLPR